jgi:hypothetical protein
MSIYSDKNMYNTNVKLFYNVDKYDLSDIRKKNFMELISKKIVGLDGL